MASQECVAVLRRILAESRQGDHPLEADETEALTAAIDALQRQGEVVGTLNVVQVAPRKTAAFPYWDDAAINKLAVGEYTLTALPPQPPTGEPQ